MSVLDHPYLSSRMFFPRVERVAEPFLVNADGTQLHCYHAEHDPRWPTVFHYHGNGECVADFVPGLVEMWKQLGCNLFLAEFRGYGGSQGDPTLVAMLADTTPIMEAAGVPPERVLVFGRSIGSIYAIEHIRRAPAVAGLVLESGVADVLERVLVRATPEDLDTDMATLAHEVATYLDPCPKLAAFHNPVLVLHAHRDGMVPRAHADRLAGCVGHEARKIIFPHGDHNTIYWENRLAYEAELRAFVGHVFG